MRCTLTTLGILTLALPAWADGEGSIKIAPADGQQAVARREARGVSSADGQQAPRPRRLQSGQVLFHLQDADLATEVLPMLEQQAGIKLGIQASSRAVTLRLVQPVEWQVALDLICEFADVHVTQTHEGKVVLRETYGGKLGSRENWDDIAGTLDAESVKALDARRQEAHERRVANYGKIKARQRHLNAQAKFNGTSATGGFSWQGGGQRGSYSRGQYSQGVYARADRQTGQYSRGVPSRGQYSRGVTSQGQYSRGVRTQGVISRGTYARGQNSRGQYDRGQTNRGQYSRGQYSQGQR